MNILTSYNWIQEHLETDLSADEFAKLTTASGNSVEHADHLRSRFDNMVVGFVKKVEAHPNADKLKIAKTDIGTGVVDIVCGGENLAEGQSVAVGLPGAKVRWHGEGDLVELSLTKIRGVESHGMICAVEEIGFDKLATGKKNIWDITDLTDAKPGTLLVDALGLDDVIFDIEVTSNRPDCYSIIGQAREGAAVIRSNRGKGSNSSSVGLSDSILKLNKLPSFITPMTSTASITSFSVRVDEPELCPKYSAVVIENVNVGPSPWWLQKKLLLAGHRPINNVVDVTNLILHEFGQPLHAFDADLLEGVNIIVRSAKKNEKFLALDGNTYELSAGQLVIADEKRAVAVAGVMGGQETGTTESTKRVVLESATFNPVSVRKTARALSLYSDSQLLFEKGLSTEATGPALARAVELIQELAGGVVASEVMVKEAKPYEPIVLDFDAKAVNRLMGIEMDEAEMVGTLERLGFEVNGTSVTVPYWRDHDIENSVDFTEEIARVYGYEQFPSILPSGELPVNRLVPALTWTRRVEEMLSGMGVTELYAYSFVSEKQLTRYGLTTEDALHIKNPLSEDLAYMRPSLLPSLLTVIEENQTRIAEADLFELAPVYLSNKNELPEQPLRLVLSCYGKDGRNVFLRAKGMMMRLFHQVGIKDVSLTRDADKKFWHSGRSGVILVGGKVVGTIGQVSQEIADAFKLDVSVVIVDLDFEQLVDRFSSNKSYTPIPTFPSVKRDLAFVLAEVVEYAEIEKTLLKKGKLLTSVELFDVYRGKGVEDGKKSLAIHLNFQAQDRTLEAKEVDSELEEMRTVLQKDFSAILRS